MNRKQDRSRWAGILGHDAEITGHVAPKYAANVLQRSVDEMDRYQDRFQDCKTDAERAQVMNWAVNYLVCNIAPNLRIDLLADSQAELRALTGGQSDE